MVATDNMQRARGYLETAKEQVESLTKEEWKRSYSFNNPNKIDESIEQMRSVIELNLSLANGEANVVAAARSLSAGFVGVSPSGYSHGVAVSAGG